MEVRGTAIFKVNIEFNEALEVVLSGLGYQGDYVILEKNHKENNTGKRAIFRCEDISYHGSPIWKYTFISDDETRISNLLLAEQIIKAKRRGDFDNINV